MAENICAGWGCLRVSKLFLHSGAPVCKIQEKQYEEKIEIYTFIENYKRETSQPPSYRMAKEEENLYCIMNLTW